MSETRKQIAVVGGGIAGLSSAYHIVEADPGVQLTVYEKGDKSSYVSGADTTQRASLGMSSARTVRFTGASTPEEVWAIRETMNMIKAVEADMAAHPEAYQGIGKTIFHPEPSITLTADIKSDAYQSVRKTLTEQGVPFSEVSGKDLKGRFPGLFNNIPDSSRAIIEEPGNNTVTGSFDMPAFLQAMQAYLSRRGVEFRYGENVEKVENRKGMAVVRSAESGKARYDRAVVAPGQWIESLLNTEAYGIKARYERRVIMDLDLKSLRPETGEVPFVKIDKGNGEIVNFYAVDPHAAGHVKMFPDSASRPDTPFAELHNPVTDAEKKAALAEVSAQFGIPAEQLEPHVKWSTCVYTYPKEKSNPLIGQLGEAIVVNGLDSSSSARKNGGYGKIAASRVLGLEEPLQGAYQKYGLDAHHALVGQLAGAQQPEENKSFWKRCKNAVNGAWHGFLNLVGFRDIETPVAQETPFTPEIPLPPVYENTTTPSRQWASSISTANDVETRRGL